MSRYNPQHETAVCDAGREGRAEDDDRPDLSDDQRAKARFIVCANAEDSREAAEMMLMLGIFPGQEAVDFEIDAQYLQYNPFKTTRD